MESKIYAIDFDGTLCENMYPKIGKPKDDIIDKVKKLKEEGHKIILWTCRTGNSLDEAIEWCNNKEIIFDAINENISSSTYDEDSRKVVADFYIDDKALNLNDFIEDINNVTEIDRLKLEIELGLI